MNIDRESDHPLRSPGLSQIGSTNLVLKNVNFNLFALDDSASLSLAVLTEARWDVTDTQPRYFNFTDVSMTVYESNTFSRDYIYTSFYFT